MSSRSTSLRIADLLADEFKSKSSFFWASRYVVTRSGFRICSACCANHREKFALDKHWIIHEDRVNKDQSFLNCTCCKKKIARIY